jgi:hypothetical protein
MPYLTPVAWQVDDKGAERPFLPTSQDGSTARVWPTDRMQAVEVECLYWIDIRLAIAPHASNSMPVTSDVGPLLEVRTEMEARVDGAEIVFDNPFHDGSGIVRWAKFAERWHRVNTKDLVAEAPPLLSTDYFDMPGHHYFAWGELSPDSLEELLAAGAGGSVHGPADHRTGGLASDPALIEIERRISAGLAEELLERAIWLRQLVRQHRGTLSRRFDERVNQAIASLRASTASIPANDED